MSYMFTLRRSHWGLSQRPGPNLSTVNANPNPNPALQRGVGRPTAQNPELV